MYDNGFGRYGGFQNLKMLAININLSTYIIFVKLVQV